MYVVNLWYIIRVYEITKGVSLRHPVFDLRTELQHRREFKLQSRYYVHSQINTLEKSVNPLIFYSDGDIIIIRFLV